MSRMKLKCRTAKVVRLVDIITHARAIAIETGADPRIVVLLARAKIRLSMLGLSSVASGDDLEDLRGDPT